jgi:osmotically-inducible protein OsmY
MKFLLISTMLAASAVSAPAVLADECSPVARSSRHDDKFSRITKAVQLTLAAKHLTSLSRIKVNTDGNSAVWLSGSAPTQGASGDYAVQIARRADAVTLVHDCILVQP